MERIKCTTVTETLMAAMEHAEEMEDVMIIYYAKESCKGSAFTSEGMKAHDALWLLEQFKAWLLGLAKRD